MRTSLFLLLMLAAACRAPTPPAPLVAQTPDASLPLPVAPTPVVVPEAPSPTAAAAPEVPVVEPFLAALAAHDTATAAALLADDVSVTLANGDACAGAAACARAVDLAQKDVVFQVIRQLHSRPDTDVVLGIALVASRRVPFAAVVVARVGKVQTVRLYADTAPWRYLMPPPKTPSEPLTHEPVDRVSSPGIPDAAQLAAAFSPDTLLHDADGNGRIAAELIYHDTARGTETHGALANQAAVRAFHAAFDVENATLLATHAAGDWLIVERAVTLHQRAPVVPVPPTTEFLHVATLEVLLVAHDKIAEVWGYSDPVAFVPAVEQPPIVPVH